MRPDSGFLQRGRGFTLIELTAVIVLVAALAAIALPRVLSLRDEARVAALQSIAGSMRSTILMVRSKAHASGLQPASSNPGGSSQPGYVIDTPFGSSEVDWRNLCPESRAEDGDQLEMLDFMTMRKGGDAFNTERDSVGGLKTFFDNRYTRVGYDFTSGTGCYVEYDSFGDPNCTVTVTTAGCS